MYIIGCQRCCFSAQKGFPNVKLSVRFKKFSFSICHSEFLCFGNQEPFGTPISLHSKVPERFPHIFLRPTGELILAPESVWALSFRTNYQNLRHVEDFASKFCAVLCPGRSYAYIYIRWLPRKPGHASAPHPVF